MDLTLALMPAPRRLLLTGGEHLLDGERLMVLNAPAPQELIFSARRLQQELHSACGLDWELEAGVAAPLEQVGLLLHLSPASRLPSQGYELEISPGGMRLSAASPAGIFYGVCTLQQLLRAYGRRLPCLSIEDWPDFPARGVLLDISRERVPAMKTLLALVDQLAGWKVNQLQLSTEHAFAYRQHPQVWQGVSPMTGDEILTLDAFCRERFIELVPNQQSFGHMTAWLKHPYLAHLAEVQEGFETPWGYRKGPFSLCPVDPGSVEFLRGLYAELLPHFSSRMFNICCDETFDLGQGRSQEACQRLGKGRVYLEFLLQIYQEVRRFGRTPQFWGDIITQHPELIPELPRDMIALEWGYEANHPFDEHGAQFAASRIPFYVCPGTSAWCSLAGRSDNALGNLLSAAQNGLKHGAVGYLNTDWGDYGHWQAWPVSSLGLLAGAAYSWCLSSNRSLPVPALLSHHAFQDAAGVLGQVAFDLGNVYRAVGLEPHNSSVLFWLMQWPPEQARAYPLPDPDVFERVDAAIQAAAQNLPQARPQCPDGELILREMALSVRLLGHASRRGRWIFGRDATQTAGLRQELAADLPSLVEEYRSVWLERNRPGGLATSAARLEKLAEDYE